jgi:hypothetical protein
MNLLSQIELCYHMFVVVTHGICERKLNFKCLKTEQLVKYCLYEE